MQNVIEQLEPLVNSDDGLCLLPKASGVYESACHLSTGMPLSRFPESLRESLPDELRESLIKVVSKRRTEFLAGRYCAAQAIRRASATATPWVGRAGDGRPSWPNGLTGSISHCGSIAIAAVADSATVVGVGIDVEDCMGQEKAETLASRILAGYPRCDSFEEIALLVTLTFSVKEALYKALNPMGMFAGGFDAADIVEWDHGESRCRIELRRRKTGSIGITGNFYADYAFDDKAVQSRVIIRATDTGTCP